MPPASFACMNPNTVVALFTYLTSLMNYQTPADLASPRSLQSNQHFDFIIVGAGAAGCVLANRLTEEPTRSVLLIEAGGEEPEAADVPSYIGYTWNNRLDWQYKTQPQERACGGAPCSWTRGKVLGGSSVSNALIYNRGNRYDYDHWARLGNHGWDYKHALPYFKKSENNLDPSIAADREYHSVGGYQSVGRLPFQDQNVAAVHSGFNELGYKDVDINARHVTGVMLMQTTEENGERRSTNRAFLEPIRNRRNLKVVTNVRVTKVIIDPKTKHAHGVEYVGENDRNIKGSIFADKEVIISGGTINTPQLLMLSGIGPRETLSKLGINTIQNLKVGQNLQDHVSTTALRYLLSAETETEVTDEELRSYEQLYNQTRRGPLSGSGIGQMTAFTNSRYGDRQIDYPDIQFLFRPTESLACPSSQIKPACYYSAFTPTPVVIRPISRGYITINSTDPFTPPLIYPNYFQDQRDIDVLTDALNEAARLANTNSFKNAGITLDQTPVPGCERFQFASDDYWSCAVQRLTATYFHYCGTCKMGPSHDHDAVVDPHLKVHGIHRLRVIDASVIPNIPSGTIVAPVIMIAEKGADLVKADWS